MLVFWEGIIVWVSPANQTSCASLSQCNVHSSCNVHVQSKMQGCLVAWMLLGWSDLPNCLPRRFFAPTLWLFLKCHANWKELALNCTISCTYFTISYPCTKANVVAWVSVLYSGSLSRSSFFVTLQFWELLELSNLFEDYEMIPQEMGFPRSMWEGHLFLNAWDCLWVGLANVPHEFVVSGAIRTHY